MPPSSFKAAPKEATERDPVSCIFQRVLSNIGQILIRVNALNKLRIKVIADIEKLLVPYRNIDTVVHRVTLAYGSSITDYGAKWMAKSPGPPERRIVSPRSPDLYCGFVEDAG